MTLKELRKQKKLTQAECAKYLGMPLRTYQNYETDKAKASSMKYSFMMQKLQEYGYIDETHGLLTVDQIKEICAEIFKGYAVDYCYLFGSYAKDKATDTSDIDLLVSTSTTGMRFYDLVESLRRPSQAGRCPELRAAEGQSRSGQRNSKGWYQDLWITRKIIDTTSKRSQPIWPLSVIIPPV